MCRSVRHGVTPPFGQLQPRPQWVIEKYLMKKGSRNSQEWGVTFSQWKMLQKEMQKGVTPLLETFFSRVFSKILRHGSQSGVSPWRALPSYNTPRPHIEGKQLTPKMEPKFYIFAPERGVKIWPPHETLCGANIFAPRKILCGASMLAPHRDLVWG